MEAPPYGPFPTADEPVFLGIQNEREWAQFCRDVLNRPELATDPRFTGTASRVAHRDELEALIGGALATVPADEVIARLESADIACARLKTVPQFLQHPQLAARGRWRSLRTPGGEVRALLPPLSLDGAEPRMDPVPALGEHTTRVLAELGIGEPRMAEWRARGVI